MAEERRNEEFEQEGLFYASRAILVFFLLAFSGISLHILWKFGNHVLLADTNSVVHTSCVPGSAWEGQVAKPSSSARGAAEQKNPPREKNDVSANEAVQRDAALCEARVWAYGIQMSGGIATLLVLIRALMALGRMTVSRDD